MNELMDRLARANPAPADEPLSAEEQHEADALLARILADRPAAEPARRRTRTALRRVAPAAAILAVAVLAAVVVIDLVGSEEQDGGILERAVAAVSREDVIYAITERQTVTSEPLEPRTGTSLDERAFIRSWLWGAGKRNRALRYRLLPTGRPGRLLEEAVVTPERIVSFDAKGRTTLDFAPDEVDPVGDQDESTKSPADSGYPGFEPGSDPGAQLRAHVESGRLRVAGRAVVRGRSAYRLVSSQRSDPRSGLESETVTYLVDARTYLPLEVRQRSVIDNSDDPERGRELLTARIEYLRYEALPVNDRTKRHLERGAGLP